MASFRRKHFRGFCETCDKETKQTILNEKTEEEELLLRCNSCTAVNVFPFDRVLKSGRLLTEDESQERKEAMSQVLEYSPENTYWKGQKIHHPAFDEVGEVISKNQSAGEHDMIVVNFENSGKKKLVENFEQSA